MRTMLIVDDHPIYRDGLRRALCEAMTDLRVMTAGDNREAFAVLAASPEIDLCLADFRLPDGDGVALIGEIRRRHPHVATGILCAEPPAGLAARVRAIGGAACLSKERDTAGLVAAVETLFNGEVVFDPAGSPGSGGGPLTLKRTDILACASEGLSDKQIGERLKTTESAVRNHWQYIFVQLDVRNRTEAVSKAMRLRLIR